MQCGDSLGVQMIKPIYLRFVRARTIDGTSVREGFFCAAYDLRNNPLKTPETEARLEDLLAWFRRELTIPPKFGRSVSKGAYKGGATGLSWFKPDANAHIAKAFEMIALLEENGHMIEIVKSARIGYVIYEDAHQIVAEPFSDTNLG